MSGSTLPGIALLLAGLTAAAPLPPAAADEASSSVLAVPYVNVHGDFLVACVDDVELYKEASLGAVCLPLSGRAGTVNVSLVEANALVARAPGAYWTFVRSDVPVFILMTMGSGDPIGPRVQRLVDEAVRAVEPACCDDGASAAAPPSGHFCGSSGSLPISADQDYLVVLIDGPYQRTARDLQGDPGCDAGVRGTLRATFARP